MDIQWLGHSCFKIKVADSVVMIDPFLKGNATFANSGWDFNSAISDVTHVVLSHGHDDHIADAAEICTTTNATLFAVFELVSHLTGKGVKAAEPMNTGGTVAADGFTITLVDAKHSSSSGGVYLGNPCGIVLTPEQGKTVLHMGDTDIFPGMSLINELHAPAIGIVPIGDRFTMGAKRAALACKKYFDFETVIPCHYGTFPIIDQSADAFVDEMKGHNVVVPKVGEVIAT
jgi:L-ascorbate metabolism protein UlaG (beta-lactamase superfamily)